MRVSSLEQPCVFRYLDDALADPLLDRIRVNDVSPSDDVGAGNRLRLDPLGPILPRVKIPIRLRARRLQLRSIPRVSSVERSGERV